VQLTDRHYENLGLVRALRGAVAHFCIDRARRCPSLSDMSDAIGGGYELGVTIELNEQAYSVNNIVRLRQPFPKARVRSVNGRLKKEPYFGKSIPLAAWLTEPQNPRYSDFREAVLWKLSRVAADLCGVE